jgi:hypothetical protein
MTAEEHLRRAAEYRLRADDQREGYLSTLFRLVAQDHERAAEATHRSDYPDEKVSNGQPRRSGASGSPAGRRVDTYYGS